MALNDAVHPSFSAMLDRWVQLRDTFDGEFSVKAKRETYLPPTSGMIQDGALTAGTNSTGRLAFDAYIKRAVFHNFMEQAVHHSLGVMHAKCATITLPKALEPLRDRATINGDSLEMLLMKINTEQLITGRIGLLLDLPAQQIAGTVLPYVATYTAERIRNWDAGGVDAPTLATLNLVVLDESRFERGMASEADPATNKPATDSTTAGAFNWVFRYKYRVLVLGDLEADELIGTYRQAVFSTQDSGFNMQAMIAPAVLGKTLDEIPFVFVNAMDLLPQPMNPPLETLSNLCLAIYRGEADYRQALFMQGQDTLVLIGVQDDEKDVRTGANAAIRIPSTDGDAKYIGVNATGLPEMRSSLENDKQGAASLAGEFAERSAVESGDAIRRRVGARTATLTDIAKAGAEGLEKILKIAAAWIGANPDEVEVEPNLDFSEDQLDSKTFVDWMTAKAQGLPLSLESIHAKLVEFEMTEMTFEDELAAIEEEKTFIDANMTPPGSGIDPTAGASGDPNNPNDPAHPNNPDPNNPGKIDPKTGKPFPQNAGAPAKTPATNGD